MKKTPAFAAGILLCLVLSGCNRQGGFADGEQARSLQYMEIDISEQGTVLDENDREADESGILASREATGAVESETTIDIGKTETTAVISNRDLEEIKKYLAQFPDTLQELSEEECYVILHGNEHSGREYLNTFIENVKAEISGELVFVQFTTEGAPVLTYLDYDGEDFYCVTDISRDGFAGGDGEKYPEEYYDSIWLTANINIEGNTSLSLGALMEGGMALELFTVKTEEALWYGLPPWAKPPAP